MFPLKPRALKLPYTFTKSIIFNDHVSKHLLIVAQKWVRVIKDFIIVIHYSDSVALKKQKQLTSRGNMKMWNLCYYIITYKSQSYPSMQIQAMQHLQLSTGRTSSLLALRQVVFQYRHMSRKWQFKIIGTLSCEWEKIVFSNTFFFQTNFSWDCQQLIFDEATYILYKGLLVSGHIW